MAKVNQTYYVPDQSRWPIIGAIALFFLALGAGHLVNEVESGQTGFGRYLMMAGVALLAFMLFGWFRHIIRESMTGLYSAQMDRSFRQGMVWFIFSEVMFFLAFFGVLFYARQLAVPWLDGAGHRVMTGQLLWPDFTAHWPLLKTPGGATTQAMPWLGIPLINTLILLGSSVTLLFAHMSLENGRRMRLKGMLLATVVLGLTFLWFQGYEYLHAYRDLGLRLDSGIYGNTFFILTGFHGLHVLLGTLFLTIIWLRIMLRDHFTPQRHFAFQAAAWYWHFVDVVWLCLFVFVYLL
ncbi:MFS transporter [Aeromonas caviae]|uniref:cytochrome-c oxidase n=1 Tax=Aeromonas caviae TaxID=648 RepID=A0ABD0B313_AERCA|nr:cytochrome c oxidase subunit 3 [Aeromonas caviae]BCR30664.1 MFS transporter [Aeromonas caviae]GJA79716.1 MFS transporter [Aeromonas caviae]GJA97850.1 MFS transporter [Aeromonas caviae]GJB09867.1 MFS transporter [Aeromonas caviae]GJB22689.1 MFS transporter [Aeromonas caviae]